MLHLSEELTAVLITVW